MFVSACWEILAESGGERIDSELRVAPDYRDSFVSLQPTAYPFLLVYVLFVCLCSILYRLIIFKMKEKTSNLCFSYLLASISVFLYSDPSPTQQYQPASTSFSHQLTNLVKFTSMKKEQLSIGFESPRQHCFLLQWPP